MDELDRKLLFLLAENARASFRELSQQVHLSPPAVAARIARLEREGLLLGYRALLAPEQCGYPLTALVSLSMPPAREPEFTAFIAGCPQVWECHHVAGPYSMVLRAGFSGTREMDRFVKRLQAFGKTQTQIIFSTVKDEPVLPVTEKDTPPGG